MTVAPNTGATVKRSGSYGLRGQTTTTTSTTVEIYQTITDLDPGTAIHVGCYVRSLRGGNPPTIVFTLLFDDVQIDKFTNTANTNNVYQMLSTTSSIQVTGGSSHTIVLRIETAGITGPVFAADDFYIIVESGPGGVPVCNPTPPPPRECYTGQTGVNLVKNPGFDNGLDSYSVSQTGTGFSSNSSVVDYAGNPSGNGFRGYTITGDAGKDDSTITIKQENIDIPDGVTASILVDVFPKRAAPSGDKPYSIAVWFDNIALSTFTSSFNAFFKLGSTGWPVTGPGPHSISLVVRTGGIENAEIFYADNFEIKVTRPTNGSRICGS
ncbi:hypothetical protein IQ07DRAFT_649422 [Pyrenochaeta sp. DS3sAY3a]|nr:hypothetical protein IQ07DRAFT_649422 [Pyrenochaeta sp. DS3sAY3a]